MKISIITAVYNNKAFIAECINSIRFQDYQDFEHILIDGNSNDGTIDVIKDNLHDKLQWISEPDKGIYDAINKGLVMASGDVIGLLHSDDVFARDDVFSLINQVIESENVEVVYGDLQYVKRDHIDSVIRFWQSTNFEEGMLKKGWMPPHPTIFIRKEILKQIGFYNLSYKIAADYDWMLRLFSLSKLRAFHIPLVITKMRIGGASNKSLINIIRKMIDDYRALKSHNIGGFYTLFLKNFSKLSQFVKK